VILVFIKNPICIPFILVLAFGDVFQQRVRIWSFGCLLPTIWNFMCGLCVESHQGWR
jgi:hypothetical protein